MPGSFLPPSSTLHSLAIPLSVHLFSLVFCSKPFPPTVKKHSIKSFPNCIKQLQLHEPRPHISKTQYWHNLRNNFDILVNFLLSDSNQNKHIKGESCYYILMVKNKNTNTLNLKSSLFSLLQVYNALEIPEGARLRLNLTVKSLLKGWMQIGSHKCSLTVVAKIMKLPSQEKCHRTWQHSALTERVFWSHCPVWQHMHLNFTLPAFVFVSYSPTN